MQWLHLLKHIKNRIVRLRPFPIDSRVGESSPFLFMKGELL
nr:MAG TPA: hypothetical protein [Caudoviricetes sp.]